MYLDAIVQHAAFARYSLPGLVWIWNPLFKESTHVNTYSMYRIRLTGKSG